MMFAYRNSTRGDHPASSSGALKILRAVIRQKFGWLARGMFWR